MHKNRRRLARDSRLYEYGAKPIPDSTRVLVTADDAYASCFSGQVALLVFLNLFGRSCRAISIDLPSVPVVEPLPWADDNLTEHLLTKLYAADPEGRYDVGSPPTAKCHIHFGASPRHFNVFGAGWRARVGHAGELSGMESKNPFGPALAAVLAATRLFVHRLRPPSGTHTVNAADWSLDSSADYGYTPLPDLGQLWIVGTGSVGTAVLYFLSLATNKFVARLFDHDVVQYHNITRSPIFAESDVGKRKVAVAGAFLQECGVQSVLHRVALHESQTWADRHPGMPDILVPTANEYNVRHLIEASLPPIQIYGTTGRNWQASAIRHIPLVDPCSLCLFPSAKFAKNECATDSTRKEATKPTDASLPFLSFAAGLMAAIELVKLSSERRPSPNNRTFYFTRAEPRFVRAALTRRAGCVCAVPRPALQREMIKGSRYEHLLAQVA